MTSTGSVAPRRPVQTAEFVGARLALARAFQNVTLAKLGADVSASFGLLGHYERGLRKNPPARLVAALANALDVQPGFFFEPLHDPWHDEECSFRRRAATSEGIKKRARAHGTLIDLVLRELAAVNVKIPDYTIPSIAARDPDAIERAAEQCRRAWGIGMGPIKHIGRVAEGNGVIVIRYLRHADKIDAFARRGDRNIIVLNTYRTSTSRWVYDVAHELGHFVLHEAVETGSKETETQANLFAGALLLPRRSFAREFAARSFSWAHVMQLKQRWVVSASAIIRRAFELALIHPVAYRQHYQYMSARGWLKREPNEPEFVGPEWLKSAVALARDRFGVTPAALADRLHLTAETFCAVTGEQVARGKVLGFRARGEHPPRGLPRVSDSGAMSQPQRNDRHGRPDSGATSECED